VFVSNGSIVRVNSSITLYSSIIKGSFHISFFFEKVSYILPGCLFPLLFHDNFFKHVGLNIIFVCLVDLQKENV
jgi:hypothetical protein